MSARRVWIVGAGKRVRETALPAFASLPRSFEVAAVLARSARPIEAAGRRFDVRVLGELSRDEPRAGDLVYVAVGKDALPDVLAGLRRFDRARLELLIDTPVLRMKHLRHASLLEGFERASVAEDTCWLPWYETARAAVGKPHRIVFDRSAYAYHGLAQAKALASASRIVRASRHKHGTIAKRMLDLDDGCRVLIVEPRDYRAGRVVVEGERGTVADRVITGESGVLLEPLVEDGACVGFRAGSVVTRLSREESDLTRGDPDGASVTARMESMKRIGFRRLLESVAAGRGAYPLADGLDDMAIDWFLERFGRWRRSALTDPRSALARAVWGTLGRIG